MNPRTGQVHTIATGFAGATALALGDRHQIYVSELFGGKISRVTPGGPETVATLMMPAGLEFEDDELFVTHEIFPPEGSPPNGKVSKINLDD